MLSKNQRIPRELFNTTFKNTKVFHTHLLTLRTTFPKDAKTAQFSFIVSAKVAKKAVERNKLRRRGYSIARELLSRAKPGVYMFFFKKEAKEASFSELKREICDIIKKLQ